MVVRLLPDPRRDVVVGQGEVLDELLIRGGFLERVQLFALHVLDDRLLEHRCVVGGADDRGDRLEPDPARGTPAALARDQLEAVAAGPNQDGLEHTDLTDRLRQRGQRLLVEVLSGLLRIRADRRDRDVLKTDLVVRDDARRDQRTEASTQSSGSCHGSPPSPARDRRRLRETSRRTR